ncbi:MAG: tRNA dihydrouridine synthase DusB [Clostridia bacterium]|nr:tRNA dihydrouridine synthase DusB [Clostridia bacterium]
MKIGNCELKYGLLLAPMAGYSDSAMRAVCHSMGAEYSVTEMVSAKAVAFGDKKTFNLARIRESEGNVAVQIFGSEPEIMANAAHVLSSPFPERGYIPPVAIDINMGCPVKKIYNNGEGSALMRDPELIYRIVRAVSSATHLPTTVKLRLGIDGASLNATECALAAEEGGADLLCVHGRTRSQLYSGEVNIDMIAEVVRAVRIPTVANGDITDAASARRMLDCTGAAGIMIGRGAVGNPFIFREIISMLRGQSCPDVSLDMRKETALRQIRLAVLDKGEALAIPESRKQIAAYFKGFRGAAALRAKINTLTTLSEVERAITDMEE